MKRFHIFRHPTEGLQSVKIGVSWPAFCGNIFWMFYHRLWILAGIWICSATMLLTMDDSSKWSALLFTAGIAALVIMPLIQGNEWREARLLDSDYEFLTTVQAATPQTATQKINQLFSPPEAVSTPSRRAVFGSQPCGLGHPN